MARKPNIFGAVMSDMAQEAASPTPSTIPRAFTRGPVGALENDLRSSMSNILRDIDCDLIDASPFADRLDIDSAEIEALAESIRKNGQRVPILLRPNPDHTGRFIIVYGRRRLAALRLIGQPARAIIRDMSDEESVLAQGQENNARLDPSFIEKAVFMHSLEQAGYRNDVLTEALCVGKPYLSHMRRVITALPEALLRKIGPAHGTGWKKWHEAVDLIQSANLSLMIPDGLFDAAGSESRFSLWLNYLKDEAVKRSLPEAQAAQAIDFAKEKKVSVVYGPDHMQKIGEVRQATGRVQLVADPKQQDFSRWLAANGERLLGQLYAEWADETRG